MFAELRLLSQSEPTRRYAVTQIIYKIDIPANRYDMLCVEARAATCKGLAARLTTCVLCRALPGR